eukprot:scaffold128274_cov39-Phaeocystis_antarctica.AAC.1
MQGRNSVPLLRRCALTPVLVLQRHVGVGEEAVLLHDGGAQDHEPAEHRVPPVPPLRLHRRAEAVLGQPREVDLRKFVRFAHEMRIVRVIRPAHACGGGYEAR